MSRALAVVLIACGLGLLISAIARGYTTQTIEASVPSYTNGSFKLLDGVWAPRSVYLNVVIKGGRANIRLYSDDRVLKEWLDTRGIIERLRIDKRGYSYLLVELVEASEDCEVNIKASFYGLEKDLLVHAFLLIILGAILYASSVIWDKRKTTLLILFPLFVASIQLASSSPIWFEPGVYASYKASGFMSVMLVNGTIIQGEWNSYLLWRCINISDSWATLIVNLTLTDANDTRIISGVDYVKINLENRSVQYKGEEVGITAVFLWPIPEKNDPIDLTKIYETTIKGRVGDNVITLIPGYGYQETFTVSYNYTLIGVFDSHNYTLQGENISRRYDTDTGIFLYGGLDLEPLLLVAGVKAITGNYMVLKKTSIDIGPSDIATEIYYTIMKILLAILIVAPIVIAILLFKKFRRGKRS